MNTKRELNIKTDTNTELREYISQIKNNMKCMEDENSGVFGDEIKYKQAKAFNSLEDWEQNIMIIYTYVGSLNKMEEYMNIKKSAISSVIKSIKEKIILYK